MQIKVQNAILVLGTVVTLACRTSVVVVSAPETRVHVVWIGVSEPDPRNHARRTNHTSTLAEPTKFPKVYIDKILLDAKAAP